MTDDSKSQAERIYDFIIANTGVTTDRLCATFLMPRHVVRGRLSYLRKNKYIFTTASRTHFPVDSNKEYITRTKRMKGEISNAI